MKNTKALLERDRAFCAMSQTKGVDGWKTFLSKDVIIGTRLHEPYVSGWDKVSPIMTFMYQLPQMKFTWEPQYAFVSEDGTLGVTTGTYERTYHLEGKVEREIGKYVSTWKWEKDNWFVIFDMGN